MADLCPGSTAPRRAGGWLCPSSTRDSSLKRRLRFRKGASGDQLRTRIDGHGSVQYCGRRRWLTLDSSSNLHSTKVSPLVESG